MYIFTYIVENLSTLKFFGISFFLLVYSWVLSRNDVSYLIIDSSPTINEQHHLDVDVSFYKLKVVCKLV